jgi:uncharacterized protein YprB with RNaseH-like and TPR domain
MAFDIETTGFQAGDELIVGGLIRRSRRECISIPERHNTLSGIYEELIGAELNELDPFTDSNETVTAQREGAYEPLVTHNVADIRRIQSLIELAEQHYAKSPRQLPATALA